MKVYADFHTTKVFTGFGSLVYIPISLVHSKVSFAGKLYNSILTWDEPYVHATVS